MKLKINNFIQSTKQFLFIKMLIFFYNDKCSKNKCSDVSIFKGKARNVDYMSSCKLRVLERFSLYKYVWTGEALAANMPCTILDFRDLPPPGFVISVFNLFHCRVNLAQTVALHISLLYICMNCTFLELTLCIPFFSVNISFRSRWPNTYALDLIVNIFFF